MRSGAPPALVAAVATALVWTLAGCTHGAAGARPGGTGDEQGPCTSAASEFRVSLAADTGGQPTPVAAAMWFATDGGVPGLPRHRWHVVAGDPDGTTVRSGSRTLHVVQGSDGTWQVNGGALCR